MVLAISSTNRWIPYRGNLDPLAAVEVCHRKKRFAPRKGHAPDGTRTFVSCGYAAGNHGLVPELVPLEVEN